MPSHVLSTVPQSQKLLLLTPLVVLRRRNFPPSSDIGLSHKGPVLISSRSLTRYAMTDMITHKCSKDSDPLKLILLWRKQNTSTDLKPGPTQYSTIGYAKQRSFLQRKNSGSNTMLTNTLRDNTNTNNDRPTQRKSENRVRFSVVAFLLTSNA